MQTREVKPDEEVTLTLTFADVSNIMGILYKASGPGISFEVIAPLVGKIQQQYQGLFGDAPPPAHANGNGPVAQPT